MKFFLSFILFINVVQAQTSEANLSHEAFVTSESFKLSRTDHIIGEHMINMIKLIEKGYVNKDVLTKVIRETEKSKHFQPFMPWLVSIQEITKFTKASELIVYCKQ